MAGASPASGEQMVVNSPQGNTDVPKPKTKTSLRGLNKPKCSKCGNVARSRCPYQCCKSCCSKAQNPCTIHVLRPNANFSDKLPTSSSPLFGQSITDVSSLSSSRLTSLRQASSNLAHLGGAHVALRARKPLSRKEAAIINNWRFSKLREHKERNIEAEDEAFDRYVQNVSLLEETFGVNSSLEALTPEGEPMLLSCCPDGLDQDRVVSALKARLRSKPERADKHRERIRGLVNIGLENLKKRETDGRDMDRVDPGALGGTRELDSHDSGCRQRFECFSAITDLLDKMSKVRSKEDLKLCTDLKLQLFPQKESNPVVPAPGGQTMVFSHELSKDALRKVDEEFLPDREIAEI
ncbi:uncharacterized protein LOC116252139 [Nymphaea colorata]|nr:uncharacterized protein LOC116252139 [Nymphaea colorata]